MRKNIKNSLLIATSILMLNACGSDDKNAEDVIAPIDQSSVQTLEDINVTSTTTCKLGEELVKGGEVNALDASKWKMTLDSGRTNDLRTDDCLINGGDVSRECIQVDPQAAGTGMYQEIGTESGKRYRVSAELIGADNVNDKNNFTLGSSYVSIEDHKPVEKSIPIALSEKVTGDIPKIVTFDFNATRTTNYISLRGDRIYRYPTAFYISVKELIIEDNNTTGDNVPCNLPK